jgi:hypothetical protein
MVSSELNELLLTASGRTVSTARVGNRAYFLILERVRTLFDSSGFFLCFACRQLELELVTSRLRLRLEGESHVPGACLLLCVCACRDLA